MGDAPQAFALVCVWCSMAVRLARYLQRSLCSDAARKPLHYPRKPGGGGLLLVPEVERLTFISRTKQFKEWIQNQKNGEAYLYPQGLTGEDGVEKLQAGAEIAFRQIAKLAEDDATDWKEQLFIGPDLRTRIADQCADWRAAGYKPVIDIQEITCEVLAPLPSHVSKPGYALWTNSKWSTLWFAMLFFRNADHSIALNVPILITAKGGSLKLVKTDAEPAETNAEPATDVDRVEHDEVVHKLQENIELTDELPIGDTMEASLGNNVWIFSCVPRKVLKPVGSAGFWNGEMAITMSDPEWAKADKGSAVHYEWKLTDINGAVTPMPRLDYERTLADLF